MRWLLLLLLMPIFFGCKNSSKRQTVKSLYIANSNILKINLQSDIVDKVLSSNFISDYKCIALESTEKAIIGNIDKAIFSSGRFYILDTKISKGIFVFDSTGKHLFSISKIGTGPGELTHPQDITISDTNIIILDNWKKILFYKKDGGKFQKQIIIPFNANNICMSNEGKNSLTIFNGHGLEKAEYDFDLLTLDISSGKILTKDLPKTNFANIRFISKFNLFKGDSDLYCIQNFNDTVYKLHEAVLKPAMFLDFNAKQMPESFKKNLLGKRSKKLTDLIFNSGFVHSPSDLIITDKYFYLSYGYNKRKFDVFIDRENGQIHEMKGYIDDRFFGALNFNPVGSYGKDKFLLALEPSAILATFASNPVLQQTELFKQLGNLKQDDNPVMIVAKIAIENK